MGSPRQRRALAAAAAGQARPPAPSLSVSRAPWAARASRCGARLTLSNLYFALLSTGCGGYARSCPWLPFRDAANAALGATRRVGVAGGRAVARMGVVAGHRRGGIVATRMHHGASDSATLGDVGARRGVAR